MGKDKREEGSRGLLPSPRLQSQFVEARKIYVDSGPPPLNLTSDDWQRVQFAYYSGLDIEQELREVAREVPIAVRDVRRFLKGWNEMSPLAQRYIAGEEDVVDMFNGKINRYRIESKAIEALVSLLLSTPRGRPATIANMRAAQELSDVWKARGRKTKPGRLYSDKRSGSAFGSDYTPNEFIKFIGTALRRLDPSIKTDGMAARRAKSAVDALHKIGRL
jgi:hypothetical protein